MTAADGLVFELAKRRAARLPSESAAHRALVGAGMIDPSLAGSALAQVRESSDLKALRPWLIRGEDQLWTGFHLDTWRPRRRLLTR
jgi:hypothetical protein